MAVRRLLPVRTRKTHIALALLAGMACHAIQVMADDGFDSNPDPAIAAAQLEVDSDLAVHLFASEPMFSNPTAIDVDERGRVWVCEAVNYRAFRNADVIGDHAEGDRILVLEDTNGDAQADRSVVFYQGHDVDSAHGVLVMPTPGGKGAKAIVSALDSVFFLIDEDGDLKADRKELLFTGIEGSQDDHGIHSFHFGPDGKLYFNFGNRGKTIKDKEDKPIIDRLGRVVEGARQPYQDGMVFRCNLDGSDFETLAWNFRNSWEVCVDSCGTMWQSDNDDDGYRACRLNYVMEYGNYGYKDEITGAAWPEPRTNREADIPRRHWHQNDPGVIPNLQIIGAGAPAGMCLYEGSLLPPRFHGALLLADPGNCACRAYVTTAEGAGYASRVLKLIDGSHNRLFRPSDICVAPDGSLMVADWCDPGVGGHRMQDVERGRIFRLTPKGKSEHIYTTPPVDVSSPEAAAQLLQSPNMAARYLAWTALRQMGSDAIEPLRRLRKSDNAAIRARAEWASGKMTSSTEGLADVVRRTCRDQCVDIRTVGVRLARQAVGKFDLGTFIGLLPVSDPSAAVRREILLGLHEFTSEQLAAPADVALWHRTWAQLAAKYDGYDRWYLEALGIAADGRWDRCLAELQRQADRRWKASHAMRDIIWRSRGATGCEQLAAILADAKVPDSEAPRFFRALDFQPVETQQRVLHSLAFGDQEEMSATRQALNRSESLSRLRNFDASRDEHALAVLDAVLDASAGGEQFVRLVDKFSVARRYPELLQMVVAQPDSQLAVDALIVLFAKGRQDLLASALQSQDPAQVEAMLTVMAAASDSRGNDLLLAVLRDAKRTLAERKLAIRALGATNAGAQSLVEIAQRSDSPAELRDALAATLMSVPWPPILEAAAAIFPAPLTKDRESLPTLKDLIELKGDAARGKVVFGAHGNCTACHQPNNTGKDIGPDLSRIGSKLARQALFESVLYPSAAINHNFETCQVLTVDGQSFSGILVSETESEFKLKDANGIVRSIPVSDVEERIASNVSLMPANIQQQISAQELVDVVEYLTTLTGESKAK
jgi:putative membrane-bound dehydrogenase-like protein